MNKNIVIKCLAADRPAMERAIQPGQTCEEVLRDCDLAGFWLSLPNGAGFFAPDENVYNAVENNDVLVAQAPADVAIV